jgi:hypothetical protein
VTDKRRSHVRTRRSCVRASSGYASLGGRLNGEAPTLAALDPATRCPPLRCSRLLPRNSRPASFAGIPRLLAGDHSRAPGGAGRSGRIRQARQPRVTHLTHAAFSLAWEGGSCRSGRPVLVLLLVSLSLNTEERPVVLSRAPSPTGRPPSLQLIELVGSGRSWPSEALSISQRSFAACTESLRAI